MAKRPIMVVPWKTPDPLEPPEMQDKAAFQRHLLDHNATLDLKSPMSPALLTRVICTLGPKNSDMEMISSMIENGMVGARLDMSLGCQEDHRKMIDSVLTAADNLASRFKRLFPVTIIGDIRGPEIMTGGLYETEKINLLAGDTITLTVHPAWDVKGTKDKVFVDFKDLPFCIKPKDKILIDFGRIELKVRGAVDSDVVCEIQNNGELRPYRDVTIPNVNLNISNITNKDKRDLKFLLDNKVDVIFASFIRKGEDVTDLRTTMGDRGKGVMIISKIESQVAFENVDEILKESDGLIVNRGKLSIEMSTEKVMQVQKTLVAKCNKAGKPIFSMTEFLNSMILKPNPTLAEATDVVNAVVDGTDGIILVEETSKGDFPLLSVCTLAKLRREAESQIWQSELFNSLNALAVPPVDPAHAIAIASVEAALKSHAAAILVATTSGKSAQMISMYKPRCPIFGVTRYGAVARQLNMYRNVYPIHYIAPPNPCWSKDVDLRLQYAIEMGKSKKFIKPGDPLILVNGWRQGAGFTNNIRFVYASIDDPWVYPHAPK